VRERRSLFGEILDWMLVPLLLLWPMSVALTWLVAQTIANRPYDRELGDLARALARQAMAQAASGAQPPNAARSALERGTLVLLRSDDEDRRYFQVLGQRGELLAGEAGLAVPAEEVEKTDALRFRDDVIGEEAVRVAYVWLGADRVASSNRRLVQVAETLDKRSRLATEIIKGVILPQFVVLPLAVLLVWYALSRGIRPLTELQQRIRRRESTDLSPIPESEVPDEVAPLVGAINDLLQRLDKTIATQRHFLADAAHQLKTPLAGLRTQAELAAREIDSGRGDPAAMKHSLRQIARSSTRAAHMVNQLLAMARAEGGAKTARQQWVDLAAVTRGVVRDFVPRALECKIDLGYEGPDSASDKARLIAEPVLAGELLRNLVDNALQYTPAGGSVTVRVLPDPFGQVVVVQVEDSGPGIAEAERELVFQPFYRALDTQQVDGSGLGLAIVREIAASHGADVNVADAHPRSGTALPGALFTVRFPVRSAPEAAPVAKTAA
jgi:two-component system, OmpR family, sensor histidine kinase TctE